LLLTNIFTRKVKVTIAGAVINFCLGIFYAWSVFADGLIKELGWSKAEAMMPYTVELLVFSVAMIFGGRFQDRFGPRFGLTLSGLFTGLGLILCALTASPTGITISFGLVFGTAAAFGYSAVTPAVIRWFPPGKRGLVTGIVLMSLGASALIWAPVVNMLTLRVGVINAFLVTGLLLMLAINLAARVVASPQPAADLPEKSETREPVVDKSWRENLRNPSFRILWLMIGLSSGIGIMFIGHLVQISELNFQVSWGYLLVSLFAASNAAGRLGGGILCDRIGYSGNLKTALSLMTAAMLLYLSGWNWPALVAATMLLGLSYGSMYTSFPTIVVHLYGLKNFGINYGLIFTAVGLVGGLGPLVAAFLAELTGSYYPTFLLGLAASLICFFLVSRLNRFSASA
jgi:MFS transporter, OFA family, oxalate/formate antiporter